MSATDRVPIAGDAPCYADLSYIITMKITRDVKDLFAWWSARESNPEG